MSREPNLLLTAFSFRGHGLRAKIAQHDFSAWVVQDLRETFYFYERSFRALLPHGKHEALGYEEMLRKGLIKRDEIPPARAGKKL